ncbi:MAG UNVERIFIED_CONTAM: hypothetical protein LVR18_51135 [Planctomycetaceae bacterium]
MLDQLQQAAQFEPPKLSPTGNRPQRNPLVAAADESLRTPGMPDVSLTVPTPPNISCKTCSR